MTVTVFRQQITVSVRVCPHAECFVLHAVK